MTTEVPFTEAERVFNKVEDLVEAYIQQRFPGAGEVEMSFAHLGSAAHPHVRVTCVTTDGLRLRLFATYGLDAVSDDYSFELVLTSQEADLFQQLVLLGACAGFWHVEGLICPKGQVRSSHYSNLRGYQHATVPPLAILAAFAGGELEALWPERSRIIEQGWYLWQARRQSVYKPIETPWGTDDSPDYLR